ncbi:hypothetical protein KBC99_02340 [Candidatus Saccharibacteria bacterium]|nr:hypothetical protein [Candidatus Saccharibacteria bacterium]
MTLTVTILDNQADILRDDITIASIGLDPWEQVAKVLLMPAITEDEMEYVLRLAGSHIRNFVRHRDTPVLGGLMRAEHRNHTLTNDMSHEMLVTQQIDEEAMTSPIEDIKEMCKQLYIPIIVAVFINIEEAIAAILADPRLDGKIKYEAGELDFMGETGLTVYTDVDSGFRFWHSVMIMDGGRFDLDVVPLYHPIQQVNRHAVGLVNGDTDAYIRGRSVRSIYAPEKARVDGSSWATWSQINHPLYAVGPSFGLKIIPWELLSQEGADSLKDVLLGALEIDGKYVAISGGFRAPAGTPTIHHSDERLGSEERVYWAIQVLKEENELEGAHIPHWAASVASR